METIISKGKLDVKEGDAPFTFLFSQRTTTVVVAGVQLSNQNWISLALAFTPT